VNHKGVDNLSLRLILGRAGAGKTEQCMQEIAAAYAQNPQGQYILITPEQATFVSEKRLLKSLEGKGGFNVRVLSFRRFAWAVLQKTGGGLAMPLDKIGKSLILRSLLEKHKNQLKRFRQVYQQNGFLEQLADFMDELRSYRIAPADISRCLNEAAISPELLGKLTDMQLLYQDYCSVIEGNWLDTAGTLQLLAEKLSLWPELSEATFWLDGFHGFTPAEFQVIQAILAKDRRVNITLNLPARGDQMQMTQEAVFYPPWETAQDLQAICRREGFVQEPSYYLPEPGQVRFAGNPELAWLEQCMGQPNKSLIYENDVKSIRILGYANLQEEVEGVANQIMAALQQSDYRYQDLVILARQPEMYESAVRSVFAAYGIPFFFDHPRTMSYHPLHHLLRALLSFISGRWNHQEMFAYLKSGLAGLRFSQVDRLENYCLAHGIRRPHWESQKPWSFTQTSLDQEMEALRQKAWLPLAEFEGKIKQAENLRAMLQAIYELLVALQVEEQCSWLRDRAQRQGRMEEALIHDKAWTDLMTLFDQMANLMGAEEVSRFVLSHILESGLEAMETLTIPPALDQVTISSMDRSRTPQAKAVWILGVNEGVLPARVKEAGLLSDQERKSLAAHDIKLAPDSEKRLFSESYLIYIALTRATQALYISFARADQEGQGQAPSLLLRRLCSRFTKLEIQDQSLPTADLLTQPRPALRRLSVALQKQQPKPEEISLWRYVYYWFKDKEQWQWELRRIQQGMELRSLDEKIPPEISKALFGTNLHTSVTRLEKFQACPFAHFMAYGLKLAPRPEYVVRAPEVGTFFHDSLEALIRGVKKENLSLCDLDQAELADRVDAIVQKQLERSQNSVFLSTAWYKALYNNLCRIVQRSAGVLAEHERRGQFRPYAVEVGFGTDDPDSLPSLVLTLAGGEKVNLHGRIDRIDIAALPEKQETYIRVIDYKSGHKTLKLWEIFYGLKLQLILYLETALAGLQLPGSVKPAGMFYFHVADPMLKCDNALSLSTEDQLKKILKELKLTGYVLKDTSVANMMDNNIDGYSNLIPVQLLKSGDFGAKSSLCSEEGFHILQEHAKRTLIAAAQRMLEGDVSISPYLAAGAKACDYCEYNSICRFDPLIPGHQYRKLFCYKDQEVWQWLEQEVDPQ
jgi:ATP-dependent helicase/nuclease subunit B